MSEIKIHATDSLKMIRESLCLAQVTIGHTGLPRADEHVLRLERLINDIDRQRPLGTDGKHGDRHTPTCGCAPEATEGDPRG